MMMDSDRAYQLRHHFTDAVAASRVEGMEGWMTSGEEG